MLFNAGINPIPGMRILSRALCIALLLLLVLPLWAAERISNLRPTVILVSIDGFRPDYLSKFHTPNLHEIMDRGIFAKYMIPSFPTKTLPNQYTMVTGLYPAHHGIVGDNIYDPNLSAWFRKDDPEAQEDTRWWGGEPIWVTAEKQGLRTAPLMWPGSSAARPAARPTYTETWNPSVTANDRVDELIGLLDRPADERPQFLALDINVVDEAGRKFGPESSQVGEAVREADSVVGRLLMALRERGVEERVNLILVSDHGMARTSPKKVVFLDDYINMDTVDVVDGTPVVMLRPKSGQVAPLYDQLKRVKHAKTYVAEDVPARWHFSGSSRITPVLLVADEGWTITTHEYLKTHKFELGNQGFDNSAKDMRALFMAIGPSFQHGTIRPFANVDLYPMMCYLLNIVPAHNDGRLDAFKGVLVERTQTEPSRKQRAPWQKEWDEVALVARNQ
jgi:predicted AlkP superfamily pyrophosphatase or phosphodiesterase